MLFPRVADAFDLYLACRSLNHVHMAIQKGKGKEEHKVIPFVSGWAVLPEPGGLYDQPQWLMSVFSVFRAGENHGAHKTL